MTTVVGRRGVTLVEIVVALTLFSAVATLILGVLRQQQRFHVGSLEIIETKRSAHQAIDLLYGELRAAASSDIYGISDSSISFRTPIGASHVCTVDSTRVILTLPSTTGAPPLSTFLALPRAGDSLLVFDSGDEWGADDDRWDVHALTSDPVGGSCPLRPFGLASSGTESASALTITLVPPLAPTVVIGAPIRFFRPASYSLYRSAGAEWMLGYSSCAAGTCTPRQPLSGPYTPFASGGTGGIAFEYADGGGASTIDPSLVARIHVVARARSTSRLDVSHLRGERYQDSLAVTIALRNGT